MRHPGTIQHPPASRYTGTAKILHWATAALVIAQFAVAWTMPAIGRGTEPGLLINLHLSFGALILAVTGFRLVWRLRHPAPPPPDGLPGWQLLASRWVHGLLYGLLLALPVLGWINASYRGWRIALFGTIELPAILAPRAANATSGLLGAWSGDVHVFASYVLIAIIGVHVLGALFHRFILRDALLDRMLPHGQSAFDP